MITSSELDKLVADLYGEKPIQDAEATELRLKESVRILLQSGDPAAVSLAARALEEVRLVPKIKSYAIKAANPTGYAIFLQEPGGGFSFQRHPTSKVELVHILSPRGASRVFQMPYDRWVATVDDRRMARWLAGDSDEELDRFTVTPEPGDVFTVETTNDVHTVLGCFLEEFASNSGDMVERLYDQNIGRVTAPHLTRTYMHEMLAQLPDVTPRRFWRLTPDGWVSEPMHPQETDGVSLWQAGCGPLTARWLRFAEGARTTIAPGQGNVLLAHVMHGAARGGLIRCERDERVELARGACLVLFPGQAAELEACGPARVGISVHEAPIVTALET